MLCKAPYLPPGQVMPVPCGRCMPCRIERRKLWTSRLLLESLVCTGSCFVTLTYEERKVPPGGNLRPADAVLWLKRLRKAVSPARLRYFLVGEYGDQTWRPHYHCLLFGLSLNASTEKLVSQTWGHGFVQLGDVTPASVRYCVGYTLKKLTKRGAAGLDGRVPEFARMSLRPGIGADAALSVAKALAPQVTAGRVEDVPASIRSGGRLQPLGRYLREIISKELGIPRTSDARREEFIQKLLDLLDGAPVGASIQEVVTEPGRSASLEARERIFDSRKKL